ncbi:GIN domain-containing protein [Sphingomonas qilianensis]|uniref:DUF2807 domain-containing protein n=1 Tax=Sphingomonas qilianensis TaxID=1736690 RepID=A0ABU9XRG0_9SPHN
MIRPLALLLLSLAAPAERQYSVGSFDRLRVDGPFRVVLTTGRSPRATAEGDPRVTDTIDIRVEGSTLVVRAGLSGWGEQAMPGRGAAPPLIRLSTGMIRSASLIGGGDVTINGALKGQRIDVMLTGSGSLQARAVDADQLVASAIGAGRLTLGGRAAKVRLSTNGTVELQAGALIAGDLRVRTDGNGTLVAQARYTAEIFPAGVGAITVYGKPACTIRGVPAGRVSCGEMMPPASQLEQRQRR